MRRCQGSRTIGKLEVQWAIPGDGLRDVRTQLLVCGGAEGSWHGVEDDKRVEASRISFRC